MINVAMTDRRLFQFFFQCNYYLDRPESRRTFVLQMYVDACIYNTYFGVNFSNANNRVETSLRLFTSKSHYQNIHDSVSILLTDCYIIPLISVLRNQWYIKVVLPNMMLFSSRGKTILRPSIVFTDTMQLTHGKLFEQRTKRMSLISLF